MEPNITFCENLFMHFAEGQLQLNAVKIRNS